MKPRALLLGTLSFCVLWFLGWEAWAVYDARQKTPAIFAPYQDGAALAITWDDLSARQQNILLTVEDPRFFQHGGVDIQTPGAGITTITQALAKRLYFEKFTPGFAKIEQTLIAMMVINPLVTKEVQINTFLNVAYFGTDDGDRIIGFPHAARRYIGTPIEEMNDLAFVRLVAMLIGPNRYRPGTAPHDERTGRIMALLRGDCAPSGNRDVEYETC